MNVYLDYAATAPLLPEVREEIEKRLSEFGNPDSLHFYGRRAAAVVTDARDRIAAVLGVRASEVYFTSGGTEADNWALLGMGRGRALLSPVEHAALLQTASRREGGTSVCGVGGDGIVTVAHLEAAMSADTGLVCVMAVNNETGAAEPIEELAAFAHSRGALFFSDCVQAQNAFDLRALLAAADGIALSAHKAGGLKGTGALVVKKGVPLRPLLTGGEQERGLRGGTTNVVGAAAFAVALELAQRRREAFAAHTRRLRDRFEAAVLRALPDTVADGGNRAPNISHLTFARADKALLSLLDLRGVACSGGAACSAHASLPSHVMLAMGRTAEEAQRGVRFSFGAETTEEEIDFAAAVVVGCLGEG